MGEKDGSAGRERESMQDIKGDIVFAGDTLRAIPYANIKHGPLCFAFLYFKRRQVKHIS